MGRNSSLPPGFRFHPTDVELVKYYLKRKVLGKKLHFQAIAEIEINKYAPWDLPNKSCLRTGDLKWYFFCPTEKKYARGVRKKRANGIGYWKTTGKDRPVQYKNEDVGMIKTLVFHTGKPPKGCRTDWVMHEYRLEEKELAGKGIAQDGYVLCVLFKKDGPGPKNGAQYGAPFNEDEWDDDEVEEEMTVQLAILPAVMHAHAVMLPNNPNMSIATSSQVSGCTSTGPLISCPSQTPSTACKTLPRVSNDAVASIESLQAVHGGVNGGEADSSAGMSAPAFQQPCNPIESLQAVHGGVNGGEADSSAGMSAPAFQQPCNPIESLQAVHGGVNGGEADSSAGMSAPAFQQPCNPSSSILASSCSYVPENTCAADIPSVSHGEAPQIVDDDDIFSHLEFLDNDHTERADFGGIAEPETDKHWSLGGLVPLEGSGDSIPISQYFSQYLPGSTADFLELMDLDTPLNQSREE